MCKLGAPQDVPHLTLLTLTRWPSRCAPRARVRCRCEATNSSATARSERRCWTRSSICSTAAAAPRSADSSAACHRRRLTRPCSRSPGALLSESAGRTSRALRVLVRRACSRPRLRGAQTWRVASFVPFNPILRSSPAVRVSVFQRGGAQRDARTGTSGKIVTQCTR